MFGLDALSTSWPHHLEDVLDAHRLGRVVVPRGFAGVEPAGRGGCESSPQLLERAGRQRGKSRRRCDVVHRTDLGPHRRRRIAGNRPIEDDRADRPGSGPESLLRALTEYEEHRLRENIRRGRRILRGRGERSRFMAFDEGLAEPHGLRCARLGEVLSTLPSPGAAPESQIRFSILVAPATERDARVRCAREPRLSPRRVRQRVRAVVRGIAPRAGAGRRAGGGSDREAAALRGRAQAPRERWTSESLKSISDTVRVDIRKLDELMNLVGELVDPARRDRRTDRPAARRSDAGDRASGRWIFDKAHKSARSRKIQELQAGRAGGAHGSAAPGLREAVAGGASPASKPGQGRAARSARGGHGTRQAARQRSSWIP